MKEFIGKIIKSHNNAKYVYNQMVLAQKIILYHLVNVREAVLVYILSASKSGSVKKFKLENIKKTTRLKRMICLNSHVRYVKSNFQRLYKLSKNILTSFLKLVSQLTCLY